VDELEDLIARADLSASTDPVTGIANRAKALAELERAAELAERHRRPLSAIRLDVAAADDATLLTVARRLAGVLRLPDLAARWSADSFLVLLPETTAEGAATVGERLSATAGAQVGAVILERARGEDAAAFSARLDAA
jgi:diguanylate cyclase (GGDEF)-like protein